MSDLLRLRARPSELEIDAWHAVVTAAHAHDLPPSVPPPGRVETAGLLCVPPVDGRAVQLAVLQQGRRGPDPGRYAGVASLRLFGGVENRTTAWLGRFAVRPGMRRRGIGERLWQEVRKALAEEGCTSVNLLVELGSAGAEFAAAHGFTCALPLVVYVQRLVDVAGESAQLPSGYRFLCWTGVVPEEHAAPFAAVRGAMADSPSGDLDLVPHRWDAARVRTDQQTVTDRGGVMLTVVAVAPDGTHAACTELVQRSPGDVRAHQHGTAVAPAHRGRGLGRAVKLRMVQLLAEQGLPVREIVTSVADDNGPMRAVNKLLGYRPERSVGICRFRL